MDNHFVIDVAETVDNKFSILEFGAFNCAGLYRCNLEPIVRELSRIKEEEYASN